MPLTFVHAFDVTIPAGTLKAAPLVTPTQFGNNVVERIEWLFPDGCAGQVGIQIGARSVVILPSDPAKFFVRSGDSGALDVTDMHTTGDWSVIAYNTGSFAHTVHVTFKTHRHQKPQPEPPYPDDIDIMELMGGA